MSKRTGRLQWLVGVLFLALSLTVLIGCGSGGGSSTTANSSTTPSKEEASEAGSSEDASSETASSGPSSSAVEAAEAEYAKFVKPQPSLVIPPLPSKPPSGKSITIVTCPLPVCQAATEPAKKAAEELGWKVKYLQTELTPEAYQEVMNQVVADPPELFSIIASIPVEVIEKQLKELAAENVLISAIAPVGVTPNENGPVRGIVVGPPQFGQAGRLMGDTVVNDHGEGAKAVFITDPSLAVWLPTQHEFTKVIEGSGGEVEVLDVEAAQIGKAVPTQVTSYVQSHPEVEYLAFAVNDLTTGVPQALESAGLNEQVKTISRAPQPTNLENIKSGVEWASVADEDTAVGYRSVDQLARSLAGVKLGGLADPAGWAQIFTSESVTETEEVPQPPGFPTVFQEAWHLK